MKKVLSLGIIFLSLFILAGCDLLPEDIEDRVSAELCREDPDHELCQVDSIDGLEEQVITEYLKDAIMKLDDGVCEDVISPTNPDLLDDCLNAEQFIPEDFSVELLDESGFSHEEDLYIILSRPNDQGMQYKIMVKVVEIDGKTYIDDWSMAKLTVNTNEITDIEADQFFKEFFNAFDDKDISNADFCAKYWYDGMDNDCDGLREDFFSNNVEITDYDLSRVSAYEFTGHVTVLKMSGGTETVEIEVEVFRQEFGPVQVKRITDKNEPVDILGMAEEKLMMMLDDYFNDMYTDEEFYQMYDLMNEDGNRMDEIKDFESYRFYNMRKYSEQELDVMVRVRFKAGAELSKKVNIAFEDTDNDGELEVKFEFEKPLPLDPIEDREIIKTYFETYFDSDLNDEDFFNMYNGAGEMNMTLKNRRDYKDRVSSDIVTINIYQSDGEGSYLVEVTDNNGGDVLHWTLEVRVNRWEARSGIIIDDTDNDCDGLCDVVDPAEHYQIFESFVNDYLNQDISDDMLNMKYFNNMMDEEFFMARQENINEGVEITIKEQIGPMGAVYIYLIDTGDESNRNGEPVKVKIKRIDMATPLLILDDDDDGDMVPTYEEMDSFFDVFTEMAGNHSVAFPTVCAQFTPEHRIDSCSMIFSEKVAMGYQLVSLMRLQQRPDLLTAEWENSVGETITETFMHFTYYNNGMIYTELIPYVSPPTELIHQGFLPYVEALNNELIPQDEACMYVDEISQDECAEIKTYLLETRNMIMINDIYMMDNEMYVIEFDVYTMNGEYIASLEYDTMVPTMDSPLYQERGERGVNPLFQENN